jgi:hypothetical protein
MAELAVEDEERQPAEVIPVQVGDEHRGDLAGVQAESAQRAERAGPAVKQHGARAVTGRQVDAGLATAAAAEGVAGACEGDRDPGSAGRAHLRPGL